MKWPLAEMLLNLTKGKV